MVTPRTLYHIDCDSVLAELDSLASYKSNATNLVPAPITRPAVPENSQLLHAELALLVDLCPLLQDGPDTHAEDLVGYTHICDGSQYACPCHTQANLANSTSLTRFTIACNKHHSCRSWWLQHQSQHGVCGCAPLMNLVHPNQHAAQDEQMQKARRQALSSLLVCLWMLVPLGCVVTLLHLLVLMQDVIYARSRDSAPTATAVTNTHPAGMESFRTELDWLDVFSGAVSRTALNDLALWLYIYREEGWGCGAVMMGIMAVLSNLPVSQSNISFAFTVGNCYTAGVCCADVLVVST
ncbi:hypothetical protein ABBQ32_009973 [Trebouxia sp. C0010 RCD-2024]